MQEWGTNYNFVLKDIAHVATNMVFLFYFLFLVYLFVTIMMISIAMTILDNVVIMILIIVINLLIFFLYSLLLHNIKYFLLFNFTFLQQRKDAITGLLYGMIKDEPRYKDVFFFLLLLLVISFKKYIYFT